MPFKTFPSRLLNWLPRGRVRLHLSRNAAGRSDAHALRAEAGDPLVLARLGLYEDSLAAEAVGRLARVGHALALAALGRTPELLASLARLRLTPEERHEISRRLAMHDARTAWILSSGGPVSLRAAIGIEADMAPPAGLDLAQDRESLAVRAALASRAGRWRDARLLLNRIFGLDGLALPLDESADAPIGFGNLTPPTPPPPIEDGPLVSIIVPVRAPGADFAASIRSLELQSWRNLEILIVRDDCDEIPLSPALDPRVRVIANDHAPGAYGARNCGICHAGGGIIMLHDADDWAHPSRVARQMRALDGAIAVVSQHIRLDGAGVLSALRVAPMLHLNPACLMVRRSAIERFGGFEEVRTGADSEFLARLTMGTDRNKVRRDKSLLSIAGRSSASLSGDLERGLRSAVGQAERLAYRREWIRRHAGFPWHMA